MIYDMYKAAYDYDVNEINIDDIINNARENENDGILMKSIISELEKNVADTMRAGECASIPKLGNIKIDSIKRVIYSNNVGFKIARKNMTKEQYKQHVGAWVVDFKNKQKEKEIFDIYFRKVMRNNKKKYDYLFTNINKSFADMYIYSIIKLAEVPFNEEFEEVYHNLKD